ncbi:MAG: methyltransferase domain-containing protein [Deltaproteobacteria bacterium]|nr:MAG: methyltransferase domain-containing protein [Deltaproteobacteria bacterium]
MRFATADVATLACPMCRGSLLLQASRGSPHDGGRRSPDAAALRESPGAAEVRDGIFTCSRYYHEWPLRDGVPQLCDEDRVSGIDRALRPIYDFIAPYHDLGADVVLPLLQFPDFGASRDRYVRELRLGELRPHADGSPVRILEVGIGSGANVPLVHAALPADVDAEIWGVDFSSGMLQQASRKLARARTGRVRLLLGDAHALPFADATFDRVFHVGGINGYRDIRKGLAEMARVARAGTPIVVVDEELDPDRSHSPVHRLAFASITLFDSSPHAPRELVPASAHHVTVTRVSRFYYCLTFRNASGNGQLRRASIPSLDTQSSGTVGRMPQEHQMAIRDILTDDQLTILREQFDPQQMNALLGASLSADYPPSVPHLATIGDLFYGGRDGNMASTTLSAANRERCLVAILAARGSGLNLALHIYLALTASVSPEEIAHILLLVGTYSGIENFAGAIQNEAKTLHVLGRVVDAGSATPKDVFQALVRAFPS